MNRLQLIYDNGKGKNPSHNLVVDVFDVMTESNSGSRTDRHLVNRNSDKSHKVADLLVDGKIYREERVALDNNSNRILIFKSGDQISSSEFRRRIGEQLKKQRSSLRSPASKKQP